MKSKKPPKLTHKEQVFIKEYLIDQNGVRSVIAAGYTTNENSAGQIAYRMLKKFKIKSVLDKEFAARLNRVQFRADDVLIQLKNIANCDIARCFNKKGDLLPLREIPLSVRKAISGVEVKTIHNGAGQVIGHLKKLRFWDKTKALELFGRHLKMWTDKIEATGSDGAPLNAGTQYVVILPPKNKKEKE